MVVVRPCFLSYVECSSGLVGWGVIFWLFSGEGKVDVWSIKAYLRSMEGVLGADLDRYVVELKSERAGSFLRLVEVMSKETGLEYWTCFGVLKDLVWTMEEERVRVGGSGWVGKEVAGLVGGSSSEE